VLGGGYPLGRIVNVFGDKSTGKTLLACEAIANFMQTYPNGAVWYNETESAFDDNYARRLGIPLEKIEFVDFCDTIEDAFEHLTKVLDYEGPGLYIIDSLDALSTRSEVERPIDKGSYGDKAKLLGGLFRRIRRKLEVTNTCLFLVSQSRQNMNAMSWGRSNIRVGGKAIDFFSSQILYISQLKAVTKERAKVKREIGIRVKIRADKNKVGVPFRTCELNIIFAYGMDDVTASLEFLESVGKITKETLGGRQISAYVKALNKVPQEKFGSVRRSLAQRVKKAWDELETSFAPSRRKYGEPADGKGAE
jgi:recombination protein RecA